MEQSKNTNKLPLPRLELNWVSIGDNWSNRICNYFLVLPIDALDIRSNGSDTYGEFDEWKCYIGKTTVTGSDRKPVYGDGIVESPFRDGAHMLIDNNSLGGLPMFAVCGDLFSEIQKDN